jgi:hypothetical protein
MKNANNATALGQSIAILILANLPAKKRQQLAQRIKARNQVKQGEAA